MARSLILVTPVPANRARIECVSCSFVDFMDAARPAKVSAEVVRLERTHVCSEVA